MSNLSQQLASTASQNSSLLYTLSQTDYAAPALQQNGSYISDLEAQIASTEKQLAELHRKTEAELKDHEKYRDSHFRKFAHGLGGSKGKDKFATKADKEEREYVEAVQAEREAQERRNNLNRALEQAENDKRSFDADKSKHDQAQRELDDTYNAIFSGPTPEVQGEDQQEQAVQWAWDWYFKTHSQAGLEKHALEALQAAHKTLQQAVREMADAHDASTMDMWGGGTMTDMMEGSSMSNAQLHVSETLRHMDEARRTQPEIPELRDIKIDQGHLMSDVFFDSIFTDMAQHDRIKASEAQIQQAVSQLQGEIQAAQQRASAADGELKQAGEGLEAARTELQRIRAEAFERLGGMNNRYMNSDY